MAISSDILLREKEIRMKKIDGMMEKLELDAILFTASGLFATLLPVKYVTWFPMTGMRRAFAFKEPGGKPAMVLPMVGLNANIAMNSWLEEDDVYGGDMMPTVIGFIEKMPQQKPRIGWVNPEDIPHQIYAALIGTKADFIDITLDFTLMRANKTEFELSLVRDTSNLAIQSFEDLVRRMKVGMTEWEILGGAIGYLSQHGAEDLLLMACSGKPFVNIRKPTAKPLDATDIFVYSAEFAGPGGYWSQLVRPVFMDKDTQPDAYEIWKVSAEAEAAGVSAIRPGNRICDIHNAIDAVIRKHGMRMTYWAGHGMGADLGDGVNIVPENNMVIVPNMVLTLHPCIESKTDGLIYGNTFVSTEGDAINLTGKYMDTPFYIDLIDKVC